MVTVQASDNLHHVLMSALMLLLLVPLRQVCNFQLQATKNVIIVSSVKTPLRYLAM